MTYSLPPGLEGKIVAGRYRVERLLGQGGMGSVWAGRHITLDQTVAIKFIHPALARSRDALQRFETEAKAAARIKSRHAVAVHDHGVTEDGQPWIVMEHLVGETLDQLIRRRGPLPLPEISAIVSQAASALADAHASGVIHRDLKPDNIFLATDREAPQFGYTVKLVDFGIAKIVHEDAAAGADATQAGVVLGTPHYMSPETLTASAPVSAASDMWSLGACAFVAASGRVPFDGEAIGDVVLKVCAAPLPVPSSMGSRLPKAFDAWFARACAREPAQRFPGVREMAAALGDLDRWAQEQRERQAYEIPPASSSVRVEIPEPSPSRRGAAIAGVLAGSALTVGALGWVVYDRTNAANEAVERTAARANAIIDAENERKLTVAERAFWDAAVTDAGADAGVRARAGRKLSRPKH